METPGGTQKRGAGGTGHGKEGDTRTRLDEASGTGGPPAPHSSLSPERAVTREQNQP